MNNRNPNIENTYSNLAKWCEQYHKDSGIKVHPSSVPVDLVLEDLMGHIALLLSHDKQMITWIDFTNSRLASIDSKLAAFDERLAKLEDLLLTQAAEVVKETKKAKK